MADLKGMNVYLSGPMTGMLDNNRDAFAEAKRACEEAGAEFVFNPCEAWGHTDRPASWYMAHDLHRLTECVGDKALFDMLVQLEGWEDSDGARAEHAVAKACGISCVELEGVMQDECKVNRPSAATPDVGTCYDTQEDEERFCCSECGKKSYTVTQYREFDEYGNKDEGWIEVCTPRFCPNCGKRVVAGDAE